MTTEQAYIEGFVKRASEYGYSKEQAFDILKRAQDSLSPDKEEQYQRARMHPAAAVLASGPLPSLAYGTYKDYQNREINPYGKEIAEIEPGKIWSSDRLKHINDHSASQILLSEQIKKMLLGGGLGGLTGAAIPALAKLTGAVDGLGGDDVMGGALLGFGLGGLGGQMYGAYTGSKKYNDMLKNRIAE